MSDPVLLNPPTPPADEHDPSPADVVAVITPAPLVGGRRVSKIDFARLFTFDERVRLNAARAQIKAMGPQAYAAPGQFGALLALEVVLENLEQPLEYIELDHPETAQGLAVLALAGVLGADPQPRIVQILAGQSPAADPQDPNP